MNEALAILREKKKGIMERLTELSETRKAQLGDFTEVMAEREAKQAKIKELATKEVINNGVKSTLCLNPR